MQQFHQWLRATGHRHNGDTTHTLHSRWRRLVNAEVEHEPYASLEDPNEPDWAPYVRLATCTEHGLEPVVGHRTIRTGDLCVVGTFLCGAVVAEDVF